MSATPQESEEFMELEELVLGDDESFVEKIKHKVSAKVFETMRKIMTISLNI